MNLVVYRLIGEQFHTLEILANHLTYLYIYINVKKTFKFINGCKANNDTYKTAKIFDSQQPQGT